MSEPILQVSNLSVDFQVEGGQAHAVKQISFDLSPGETLAIVGESGSFRHVIGLSVFWDTPLGPLQFNVSDALKKESFDKEQSFEVTLRTTF